MVALPRPGGSYGEHRLGLSVSKAHGGAVRRNNIKRRLREAFRLERPQLPGSYDLILIPKVRDGHWSVVELRAELPRLLRKIQSQPKGGRRSGRRQSSKRTGAVSKQGSGRAHRGQMKPNGKAPKEEG